MATYTHISQISVYRLRTIETIRKKFNYIIRLKISGWEADTVNDYQREFTIRTGILIRAVYQTNWEQNMVSDIHFLFLPASTTVSLSRIILSNQNINAS